MRNELLLIASLFVLFGMTIAWYKIFGRAGLYAFTAIATIAANIEVLILVHAFGMDMTLGNVLFATTFTCTEILSEMEGKKYAKKAVWIGICTTITFIIISQSWFLFTPAEGDFVADSVKNVFTNSPRVMLSSLVVYAICQFVEVHIYSWIWKKMKNTERFLWVRSNVATLAAQVVNTVLFTTFAFLGVYDMKTLGEIMLTSYAIFIVTSLFDTPALYFARWFCRKPATEPTAIAE